MKRFVPILKHINERLVLPQPLKYRIMKEIAADLEDTFIAYTEQDLGEDEAEAKALEKIAADDTVIEQLIEVHETPVRKILRRLSKKMLYRIEIALWISFIVIVSVIVSAFLISSDNFAGSIFNWITGLFIICIFGISVSKYYELFIKRDYTVQSIHRGLSLLIFICCLTIIIGTLGFFVELQESISITRYGAVVSEKAVAFLLRSFTVICFSFSAAVAGAIIWLIMTIKTLNIEDKENAFQIFRTDI